MNIKLLITALCIIIFSNILVMISIIKIHLPYTASMFIYTVVALLLWFFLLKKNVPLNIKYMNMSILKASIPLIIVTFGVPLYIITSSKIIDSGAIEFMVITSLLISIYEEVIFRGIGLGSFISSGITPIKAILLSSAVFSLFHIGYITSMGSDIVLLLLNTFMMGYVLGFIYYKSNNILVVILIHFLWDFAIFVNQKIPTEGLAFITTLILFATSILYVIWSIKGTIIISKSKSITK